MQVFFALLPCLFFCNGLTASGEAGSRGDSLDRIAQPGGESPPHLELSFEGTFRGGEAPVGIFPSFLLYDSDCP